MKTIRESLHIIESSGCIPKMWWNYLWFNTSWGLYSAPKKFQYTTAFLSINNESQRVLLLCLSSRFMTYAPTFIVGILSLEKISMKPSVEIATLSNVDIA